MSERKTMMPDGADLREEKTRHPLGKIKLLIANDEEQAVWITAFFRALKAGASNDYSTLQANDAAWAYRWGVNVKP